MNTHPFCEPRPNIIHLPASSDCDTKSRFIRSCDAMLHARYDGETFGLAVAEFSAHNREYM
jgi:glycosyltransferase involved in cell wall biosynthesis